MTDRPVLEAVGEVPTRWRKKPVVVEAVQFFGGTAHPEVKIIWRHAISGALLGPSVSFEVPTVAVYGIETLEGWHQVTLGDWIIKGVKGEFYPCKPDIFAMTYEPAPTPIVNAGEER